MELRVDGHLVVQVTCDGGNWLMFDFPKGESYSSLLKSERLKPLELSFDDGEGYRLRTRDAPTSRLGWLEIEPKLLKALDRAHVGWFWGPSEMGESWPLLNFGALRQLAYGCATAG